MKVLSTSMVVALVLPALTLAVHWEDPFIKSFADAQKECVGYLRLTDETLERYIKSGYPDEHSTRKLIHCILVNLHAWDQVNGITDYVFSQFFDPAPSDSCNKNRTEECLYENVARIPLHEQLKRAHRSFLCYYRNFGNINEGNHFIPYSNATQKQHYKESFEIQDVTRTVLQQWADGDIVDTPQFSEVFFTFVTRTGFYNPDWGFDLDRVYVQTGNSAIITEETRSCEASVRKQYCEEPKRVAQTFKQCLKDNVPSLPLIQEAAKEILESIPVPPCPSSAPSSPPCYSCGAPSPCKSCNQRFNADRPCYNGQCF
ncbi:conserved hypothetical protein [Culex quinquefasciatus]|uniref:Uncharacterized protein n=1 Tax=Culex quinquefasciatus TaxID=7176 RepID=B0W9W9_CULQU|nr:conserved hypothetical protein [Culex quinquefasciatus]|eukprot:XP_001845503.1 conserved hypothetical protein [Culex quinquefasciatus]